MAGLQWHQDSNRRIDSSSHEFVTMATRLLQSILFKTLQDALFICYKQSPDNAHSVAFSQRSSSPHLIEDETFNDSGVMNNLIDYEDGQEEPDSLRVDKNMQRDPAFQLIGKAFSSNKYQLRKEYKIPKRASIMYIWLSGHLQATDHPTFVTKTCILLYVAKN
ncbi:uncharacterized protein TNCV_1321811 [Trichonephila clavipes]|nr:uncharacterized protein TNCV_1321811 [Trichonephila clavipes]